MPQNAGMEAELTWEPPGDGVWWLTREHFPAPVCRLFAVLFPPTTDGWRTGAARYGLPAGESGFRQVNSWLYYSPGDPPDPSTYDALEPVAAETLATRAPTRRTRSTTSAPRAPQPPVRSTRTSSSTGRVPSGATTSSGRTSASAPASWSLRSVPGLRPALTRSPGRLAVRPMDSCR